MYLSTKKEGGKHEKGFNAKLFIFNLQSHT